MSALPSPTPARPSVAETLVAVGLAGTSGAALLVHAFGPVPLSFTAPFVVLPASLLLVGAILIRRRQFERVDALRTRLVRGAGWGLIATLAYDVVRPLIKVLVGYAYDPYRAMPIFGSLITGLPGTDPLAIAAGWLYHFWNGITFGVIFALVRPRGGVPAGIAWAMALQVLMMLAYPTLLKARLDDPGFLMLGLVGHTVWGIVLGAGLRRMAGRDAARGAAHA